MEKEEVEESCPTCIHKFTTLDDPPCNCCDDGNYWVFDPKADKDK